MPQPQPMVEQPKIPQPPPPQQVPRPEPPPQPEERMLTGVSNGAQVIQSTPLPDGFVPPVASLSPLKVPASDLSYSRAQRRGERLAMQMRRDGSLKTKSPHKVISPPQPEEAD